ncbi:MAG: OprO/OprP family phosphate-selective porin [Bacteroidales bacterium]|nr:OprO/OprP family phosphate-selective porin [Bacteroidales bacterium]
MQTKKIERSSFNKHGLLKHIFMLGLLLFIIQPAWTQNTEGNSDSKEQASYPDLQPAGFLQTHFSAYDIAERPANFSIHRARFGFTGYISKNIRLNLIAGTVEPPNNEPALVNAFADFTIHPLFNLRVGQFLLPFGLEGPEPIPKNPAIERAFSTRNMNPFRMFRDVGVMAYGEHEWMNYSLALVNGSGANILENANPKDLVGRIDFSLTETIMAGVSSHIGTYETPSFEKLDRKRWGAHAEYKNNPIYLRGEIMLNDQEIAPDTREQSLGGYLLGRYKIAKKWEAIGRWDYHEPDNPDNVYQGITLGTNYQLIGASNLSLNGTVYTEDDSNTLHYMVNVQLQLVL